LVLNEQLKLQQGGLKELWSMIDPVWKKSQEELIEMMAGRVIYESGFFIFKII
jgi:hypothetical protein